MKKKLKLYVSYERTGRKVKHRIICNILLATLFGYRIYVLKPDFIFSEILFRNDFLETLLFSSFTILPLLAIIVAFIANFVKHPYSTIIVAISFWLCIASFLAEGFIWVIEIFACCDSFVRPLVNILVVMLAAISEYYSIKEYEKKKKAGLLNSKKT